MFFCWHSRVTCKNLSHLCGYTIFRVLETRIPESCEHDEKFTLRLMCDSDTFEKCTLCKQSLHHFLTILTALCLSKNASNLPVLLLCHVPCFLSLAVMEDKLQKSYGSVGLDLYWHNI